MLLLKAARKLHGRMDFNGLQISIENRRGSIREWYDPHNDEHGMTRMRFPYGYIRLSEGEDGDAVDCYIGPHRDAPNVYVVHQAKAPDFKNYDEDKCMLGFTSAAEAKKAYLEHYTDPRFFMSMTTMPFAEFKEKVLATRNGGDKMIKSFTEAEARKLGDSLGIDWNKVDINQFIAGLKEEEEHKDVTGGDPVKTAKIALAHLKEDSRYYSKLKEAMKKSLYLLRCR